MRSKNNNKNRTLFFGPGLILTAGLVLSACDSSVDAPQTELITAEARAAKHVAIRIQAENYTGNSERWLVTTPDNIPTVTPDPDPPHYSTASGQGYIELLPDTRVTHDDDLNFGASFWGDSTSGPSVEYMIEFNEPGRYVVYAKAYSTGLEDNGIHVGFDDQKPESGKRLQLCSGKNKWTWSSAQRVPENHCGVAKSIYLDIPNAGYHKVVFYAREDGFEIDQFVLLKDPEDGSEACALYDDDRIRCIDSVDGSMTGIYDVPFSSTIDGNVSVTPLPSTVKVDLSIDLSADNNIVRVGDDVAYTVNIKNNDNTDAATSVIAEVTLPTGMELFFSNSCLGSGNTLKCQFSEIGPGDTATAMFTAKAVNTGKHRVDVKVTADQDDTTMGNNAGSVEINADPAIPNYDAAISLLPGSNAIGKDSTTNHLLIIENMGLQPIADAQVEFASESFEVTTDLNTCQGTTTPVCSLPGIPVNESITVPVQVRSTTAGEAILMVSLLMSGDENIDNNSLNITMHTSNPTMNTTAQGDLAFEAEAFNRQNSSTPTQGAYNSAWFINSTQLMPTVTPDFDSTAADSASSSAYMELLPDTRTGQSDPTALGVSNFLKGEDSPALMYEMLFDEPGQYSVNARLRANNTQDAGIHIGIDDQWPPSTRNITVCSPDGEWQWTQSQIQNKQCNTENIALLNVQTAGIHTIMLAAATDGVEVDKIVLRKNATELPELLGGLPVEYVAEFIDLELHSSADSEFYRVEVVNPDTTNTAIDINIMIEGLTAEVVDKVEGFDQCIESEVEVQVQNDEVDDTGTTVDSASETQTAIVLNCSVGSVAPGASRKASISLINPDSDKEITASLSNESDPNPDNNTTSSLPLAGAMHPAMLMLALIIYRARRRRTQRTAFTLVN